MSLAKIFVSILFILSTQYVVSSMPSDIAHLREHFITNLLEDNRENLKMQITDSFRHLIEMKITSFLDLIDEKQNARFKRNTNDVLLNEKTTDVNILKGFQQRGNVPIKFPRDICMFRIHEKSFAVGMSFQKMENILMIFKRENGSFEKIYEYRSKFLTNIDCHAVGNVGYVAVVNSITIEMSPEELLKSGSFVYRVKLNANKNDVIIDKLQTFADLNHNGVRLWSRDEYLYLVYTYNTDSSSVLEKCTLFKLSERNFNPIDALPCQNSKVVEFFTINHDLMVLIGNNRENNGTTNAFSSILRYDLNQRRFVEHQKIYTNAITVGKYFYLDYQNQRQHFLFIGNSYEINEFGAFNYDVLSLIYKFIDGYFVPLQTMKVKHVQSVAPIITKNNDFHLLITSEDRDVQIYYFDGWKFLESTLDFTGNVFTSGVLSMRTYSNIIDDTTTIVLSNVNSNGNQWNIYTPIYIKRNDTSKLKSNIVNWCSDAFARLDDFNVDEADKILNIAANLTDASNHASFGGKISISNSTIKSINASQLIRKNLSTFNSSSVERIHKLSLRNRKLQRDIKKLKDKVDFTMTTTSRIRRQAENDRDPLISKLIVSNSFDVQTLNGRAFASLANKRNKGLKSIVANEIAMKKELFVDEKIDGIEISQKNLILNAQEQVLNPMTIEKLNVRSAYTNYMNNMSFNEFYTFLRRKVDRKIPNMIHQLDVDVINVGNHVNEKNFTANSIDSLKILGNQFIPGDLTVETLHTNGIMYRKNIAAISAIPINHLLNIKDSKSIYIPQDIQFAQDLAVTNLFIQERINNVNVKDGKLQVLRKRGVDEEQTVTGEKNFDIVNLKQSIVLRGKIESKTLEKMNPITTIDKNLVLEGDYEIEGPVTIRKYINATENILTNNEELNLSKLAKNGLNLYTSNSTKANLNFKNFVEVSSDLKAKSINDKPTNSFIKLNFGKEQIISGLKSFKKGLLVVSGTVQADKINDVDLKRLNETILKIYTQVNQFIDGNIEFADLKVDKIISRNIRANEKEISQILNTNKPQNLKRLSVDIVEAENIFAATTDHKNDAKIFGNDLNFLIDDSIISTSFYESFIASKNFLHLSAKQLDFAIDNEWKAIIANFNNMITHEFNVTGDYAFEVDMKVGNIQIYGKINGIKIDDMKMNWLKVEGEQIFTAPQVFKSLRIDNDIKLSSGVMNEIELKKLIQESIWIDEPISVDNMEISGTLIAREKILSPLINGVTFDDKIIFNNTMKNQKLGKIIVHYDAHIRELKFDYINEINIEKFTNAFQRDDSAYMENMRINGVITSNNYVNISTLNDINLQNLHNGVWLRDRNVTLTGDDIQFLGESEIESVLYADRLNTRNLDYYLANYFSKSKNEVIYANLNVAGVIKAKKSFYAEKIIIPKFIMIDEYTPLNINEFSSDILRHDISQNVSGDWKIQRLFLFGNYEGHINGINIQSEILHSGNIYDAQVTGHKYIGYLIANDIKTKYANGILLNDWFGKAVKINSLDQQFIENGVNFKGRVRFDNNIQVYGDVNGIRMNPNNILTKSSEYQLINGDITIDSMSIKSNQIRQVFIERFKLRGDINERKWATFNENAFTRGTGYINSNKLIFENELQIDTVWTNKSIYGTNIGEFLKGSSASNDMIRFKHNMEHLTEVCDDFIRGLTEPTVELSHFEHHQSIPGRNIQKTIFLSIINGNNDIEHIFAVHERNEIETISFYQWNREQQLFISSQITSIQYNSAIFQITQFTKFVYANSDRIFIELFDMINKNFVQMLLQYDFLSKSFVPFIKTQGEMSIKVFTWSNGSVSCYGSVYQSYENFMINCEAYPQTVIQTKPIKKISSHDNLLLILTEDERVQVWKDEKFYSLPSITNPQTFNCIKFGDRIFLAVQSDKYEGTVHHGYINIYVSDIHEMKFDHLQRITPDTPIAIKFSKAPSGDLMLYILTKNPTKALQVYSYAGSSNFVKTVGDTIISKASDLDVTQIDNNSEIISVVSSDNVDIIQAVLIEY